LAKLHPIRSVIEQGLLTFFTILRLRVSAPLRFILGVCIGSRKKRRDRSRAFTQVESALDR
jgi:hypothetical protein